MVSFTFSIYICVQRLFSVHIHVYRPLLDTFNGGLLFAGTMSKWRVTLASIIHRHREAEGLYATSGNRAQQTHQH